MTETGKPIWYQGMFMRPQHFQQLERYWETFINEQVSGQFGYGWGLRQLEIDESALALGKLHITKIALTLPEGTPLKAPGLADLPPPRDFDIEAVGKRVMLALPIRRTDASEVFSDESPLNERRWKRRSVSVRDTSREDEEYCDVEVGRLAPVLLLEGEAMDAYTIMPIARIASAADGEIALDEEYLPPVMNCRAHARYMRIFGDIRAILRHRANSLTQRINPTAGNDLSGMLDFLLLQMINRHEAGFAHITQLDHIQPERAFLATAELAGELTTFLPKRHAEPPPVYDHADPGPGWHTLVQTITSAFDQISDRQGVQFSLERQPNGSHVAAIHDRGLLDTARFILILRSNSPLEVVQGQITSRLKVGSVERLSEIVNLQLSGIPCRAIPVVPHGLPYYPDASYLELDRMAPVWQEVRDSASLAIYLAWSDAIYDLQLWALNSNGAQLPLTTREMP